MEEQMVEGEYEVLPDIDYVFIRPTTSTTVKDVGAYYKNERFTVYEVKPEVNGIVWGRVCSNATGKLRFVGLRVNNHPKAVLVKPFAPPAIFNDDALVNAIDGLTVAVKAATAELAKR
jgi:hypothetical protein